MSETDQPAVSASGPRQAGDFFHPGLLLVETAGAAWLGYAFAAFTGLEGSLPFHWAAGLAAVGATVSVLAGGASSCRLGWCLPAALAACLPLILLITHGLHLPLSWRASAWLAGALAGASLLLRIGPRPDLAEGGRRVAVLLAASVAVAPFYTFRPIGSGDAHWYTLMLADYVAQTRAGVFPVWAGQTEYAFNGAINPLRLAPWFQHFAALLDTLTARRLDFIALKNAVLVVNFLVLGGTAYACLHRLLPGRATAACLLTLLLLASPAALAPLYTGDQYMTFLALPFACLAVFGLTLVLTDDRLGHFLPLSCGLAGLWLTHTPMAVWMSALLSAAYAVRKVHSRAPGWPRRLGLAFLAFVVLGTYPILSALSLENTNTLAPTGIAEEAARQIIDAFPACLLPLSPNLAKQSDYQPGYSLLAVAALAALAAAARRDRIALALAVPLALIVALLCPVPAWAQALWGHMPDLLMQINGAHPQQRLVPIAAVLIVFLGAIVLRDFPSGRLARGALIALALAGLAWSGHQAAGFVRAGRQFTAAGEKPARSYQTNNLTLTRYAFSSFATTPGYFSHGYINPLLEHRLLGRDGQVIIDNHTGATQPPAAMLLAAGGFTAVNDNNTTFYNLSPALALPEIQQLALKVDPLEPIDQGWIQVVGQDVFREYILPDSGTGTVRISQRSFGTLPGSSRVIPLRTWHPGGETPRVTVILPNLPRRAEFPFARFELWQFDTAQLPVAVKSWAPYRLRVTSPQPAFVETPRSWQSGYYAIIGGQRVTVQRSPENLAMFPVPAGESSVEIHYRPAWPVAASYWLTLAAWVTVAVGWLLRRIAAQRTSAG